MFGNRKKNSIVHYQKTVEIGDELALRKMNNIGLKYKNESKPAEKKKYDFLIINEGTKWKAVFDFLMNWVVLYHIIMITLQIFYEIQPTKVH